MTRSKPPNRESVSSPEISGAPRTPENVSETKPVSLHDQITQTTLTLKKKIKQLKATRKLVNASSAQYILQRESLGLPPDPSTPPGVQESQNRVEKLSTQERELAQENHLLEIEATIGMLSSDRVKDKVVKIKSETGDQYHFVPNSETTLFGVLHSNDPESRTIQKLNETVRDAIDGSGDELIFLIEGTGNSVDQDQAIKLMEGVESMEKAVQDHGENGAIFWAVAQAKKEGRSIQIKTADLPDAENTKTLLETYSPDQVALSKIMGQLTSEMNRVKQDQTPEEKQDRLRGLVQTFYSIQRNTGVNWIQNILPNSEIATFMNDKERFGAFLEQSASGFIHGMNEQLKKEGIKDTDLIPDVAALVNGDQTRISMDDINTLSDAHISKEHGTILNEISGQYNQNRDRHLFREISHAVNSGKKPFVVFGASHTVNLEPAINQLFQEKQND